jgi:predicted RNase H-like nuclease (RuvC/YqgF family)
MFQEIWEKVGRLFVEHASAEVLQKHMALLKDEHQFEIKKCGQRISELEAEVVLLKAERDELRSKNEGSAKDSAKLKKRIEELEKPVEPILQLEEIAENMLLAIAEDDIPMDTLYEMLRCGKGRGDFVRDQLLRHKLIRQVSTMCEGQANYEATPKGCEYLDSKGLLD